MEKTEPKASDTDCVEIIQTPTGDLVAVAKYNDQRIVEPLPKTFETWTDDEQRAHLKRFVVPRLRVLLHRAKDAYEKMCKQKAALIVESKYHN